MIWAGLLALILLLLVSIDSLQSGGQDRFECQRLLWSSGDTTRSASDRSVKVDGVFAFAIRLFFRL